MRKTFAVDQLKYRVADLLQQIANRTEDAKTSGRLKRQVAMLQVIISLIETYVEADNLQFDEEATLMQIIERKKGRRTAPLELYDRQPLAEILAANPSKSYNKLKAAIESAGYKIVLDHIELA
jgi:hypothetical protein